MLRAEALMERLDPKEVTVEMIDRMLKSENDRGNQEEAKYAAERAAAPPGAPPHASKSKNVSNGRVNNASKRANGSKAHNARPRVGAVTRFPKVLSQKEKNALKAAGH